MKKVTVTTVVKAKLDVVEENGFSLYCPESFWIDVRTVYVATALIRKHTYLHINYFAYTPVDHIVTIIGKSRVNKQHTKKKELCAKHPFAATTVLPTYNRDDFHFTFTHGQ